MKSQLKITGHASQFTPFIKRHAVTVSAASHCGCEVGKLENSLVLLHESEKYASVFRLGTLENVPNSGIVCYQKFMNIDNDQGKLD